MMLYFSIKYNLIRAVLYIILFKKRGYGAEIGVWKGWNAKMIYHLTKPEEFILIDPYHSFSCDGVYPPQSEMDGIFARLLDWAFDKPILVYRKTSKEMSAYTYCGGLDWIYIDGNHFDVYNDLTNWYDNVKEGGIIMGDDYGNKGYPLVKKDVDKFCEERGIKLHKFHFQWWFKR